jgi:hypothetical protein
LSSLLVVAASHAAALICVLGPLLSGPLVKLTMSAREGPEAVDERLRPIRYRRSELVRDRGYLRTILRDGSQAARGIARHTLTEVAAAMHTTY